jgi:cell division protein FtsB
VWVFGYRLWVVSCELKSHNPQLKTHNRQPKTPIFDYLFIMKLIRIFRNKFLIATIFFVVWMLFFDHNNIFLSLQYRNELKSLTDNKAYYKDQIEKTRKDVERIKTNPLWIEKVAREQYLMKREGEDIFVIKEK